MSIAEMDRDKGEGQVEDGEMKLSMFMLEEKTKTPVIF